MIKFYFNVYEALANHGFNTYTAKVTGKIGLATMKHLKDGQTNISLDTLNKICEILDMQPKDLIYYVPDDEIKTEE